MPQRVRTQKGLVEVLTLDEFEVMRMVRNKNILQNSIQLPDGSLICYVCHDKILGNFVLHPIWEGLLPRTGKDGYVNELVPYCPNCDKRPNSIGCVISLSRNQLCSGTEG